MQRVLGILLLLTAWICAQDEQPAVDPVIDPSTAEYDKALKLFGRRKWSAGRKALRRFLKKYPASVHAPDAANRSDDNCYLGTEVLWRGGPSTRRIDVAVMGDGFTIESALQRKQRKWADEVTKVLWNEKSFSRYRNYFNIYFVRLASLEEGVDPKLTPEQLKKIQEKNRHRSKSRQKKTDFSTALDAKAMGPQGQVMMSRALVYKWLDVAEKDVRGVGDDRYVIAFAQFGRLGMGGGGIANVGRPDKSVTTHEFGHAFSRLLDEYSNQPGPPRGMWGRALRAANVHVSNKEPKKSEVPWAHFLKRHEKYVGIYEGGATYKKGVWRPARSCAMNAAGNNAFCPVCREQTILVIYEHVNPIDEALPAPAKEIVLTEGDEQTLTVVPMEPLKRQLDVKWYVADRVVTKPEGGVPEGDGGDPFEVVEPAAPPGEMGGPGMGPRRPRFAFGGQRGRADRSIYNNPPSGKAVRWAKFHKPRGKGPKRTSPRSVFPLSKLGVGTWRITCQVEDDTRWVLKDEKYLLKERVTWNVTVRPKVQAAVD